MKILRFVPFVLLGINGCIDPFNTSLKSQDKTVGVDGLLTDQSGPHTIRLSYSSGLGVNDVYAPVLVSGASVSITDDQDNTIFLQETSTGVYQTGDPNWKAIVGRAYH